MLVHSDGNPWRSVIDFGQIELLSGLYIDLIVYKAHLLKLGPSTQTWSLYSDLVPLLRLGPFTQTWSR